MYCTIYLPSGKLLKELTLDNHCIIVDLLNIIENELNFQNVPFCIVYYNTILNWNDKSKLYEIFISKEPIILTIIISQKIPETFNNFKHLINYINNLNTSNRKYLDKLSLLYISEYDSDDENDTNDNDDNNEIIETKLINIHFILNFFQIYGILPSCIDPNIFSNELFTNRQFIMIAVQNNGTVLQYASKELQNDKEIVMIAVQNNRTALQYASKELQNDKEIITIAVLHS
jgi:hypothetical protein